MAIPYSYPQPLSSDPIMKLSREEILNRNLEISLGQTTISPQETSEPFIKHYNSNSSTPESLSIPLSDPIDDIFRESKKHIEAYKISLPTFDQEEPKIPTRDSSLPSTNHTKRKSRGVLEPITQIQMEQLINIPYYNSELKTPTKTAVETSLSKKQKSNVEQSTAVSENKDYASKRIHQMIEEPKELGDEDISQDPLACHAGNIMRMAMDSTIMDSFCNHSFSSTFSNLVDDSGLGRGINDVDDADRSVLERLRAWPKSSLDPKKAKKIEISAEELDRAINEPIR